jgi:hypothetical protein
MQGEDLIDASRGRRDRVLGLRRGVEAVGVCEARRWNRQLIGLALILVGSARAWEDIDTGNALAYVFVVGIAGLFVALLGLECAMVARAPAGRPRAPPRPASSRRDRPPCARCSRLGPPLAARPLTSASELTQSAGART